MDGSKLFVVDVVYGARSQNSYGSIPTTLALEILDGSMNERSTISVREYAFTVMAVAETKPVENATLLRIITDEGTPDE